MTTPASPRTALRAGFVPGVILTKWRTIWAKRFPRLRLDVVEVGEHDARGILDRGEADVCFARLPIDTDGLHVVRLYEEQPVVWVAKEHPVAAFEEIATAELADETVLTLVDQVGIDRVLAENAVFRVPLSVARVYNRRDLVHRPVTDAPPTTIALAWRRDVDDAVIQDFVGVVRGRTANTSRGDSGTPGEDLGSTSKKGTTRRGAARKGSQQGHPEKDARSSAKAPGRGSSARRGPRRR